MLSIYFSAVFFFSAPNRKAPIRVPMTRAARYIIAFPTTGNTKIPPWGAMRVHPKAMDRAPETPAPTTQAGST